MENNIVNVYGYIRVSTEGQVKQGYSLAEQRAEIEKYCSSKSYNLVEIFKDEGISGAKANEDEMSIERDGLLDMLASLKENKIQYIIVLSTNRLWRSDLVKVLLHGKRSSKGLLRNTIKSIKWNCQRLHLIYADIPIVPTWQSREYQ